MTEFTSHFTRNTCYFSDSLLFSSMSKSAVECFDKSGINCIEKLDRREAIHWSMSGHCPIASVWLQREASIAEAVASKARELKVGNWSYFGVQRQLGELEFNLRKAYSEENKTTSFNIVLPE